MSCDAAALAASLFLASASPQPGPAPAANAVWVDDTPASVAREPLFADIVSRARRLNAVVERARTAGGAIPDARAFAADITALAALDLQGHEVLKARGGDSDLKCILRGISQDLALKLRDLEAAPAGPARDKALREMSYLLKDNYEVILAPPAPPV